MFNFCKKSPNCLPKWLYCFAFPPAINESSHCSTSSAAGGGVSVLDFHHSKRCAVLSCCCFNLSFPGDIWCWASFYIFIYHPYISFGEVSVHLFCPFLIGLFISLLWSFKSSLYIFNNSSLSDVSFVNILSQSKSLLFVLYILLLQGL